MTVLLAGIAGVAGVGLFLITIRRPVLGAAALVLLVPLTAGLARGAVIPLLKPSEAILLIVLAGVVAHQVATRAARQVSLLDLAVGGYVLGSVVIPWMVLFITRSTATTLDTWRTVLSPALFLAVYYIFSRTQLGERDLRLILNCALAGGVIVSVIAAAELANVPGVRSVFANFYTGPLETPYRPSSTLGHYSAVGGLGLLTYIIALSLAAVRKLDFPSWWLIAAMGAGLMGVVASETWAPTAVLPLATIVLLLYGRRVPRQLLLTLGIGIAATALLWPLISTRIDSQQLITAQGLTLPETMQTRITYWNEFIIPALSDHLWLGTGTVIPSSVPDNLTTFVDNEYLWAGFRAGLPGIALLVGLLLAMVWVGWSQRSSTDPSRRALGAATAATALMLVLLGATAQYITFAGLSQEIAMLVGIMSVLTTRAVPRRARVVVIQGPTEPRWIAIPRTIEAAVVELRQLKPESGLLRSSAIVFAGFTAARALGFLFSVASARILNPLDYGRLTYALAVITATSMFISSSPIGLSRFLSRNHEDRNAQESYFTNWVALIGFITVTSAVLVTPAAFLLGLSRGLVVGLLCNLVGIAVLETYREAQRGLDRYSAMMNVYVAANLLQLVGILLLAAVHVRSAAIYLIIYGLSSVVALALMHPIAPIALRFVRRELSAQRIKEIFLFIRPVLAQSVFYAIWFSSDLILIQHLMNPRATGNYAVAKALVNVLILAPTAIGTAILPRIARLGQQSVVRYMVTALGFTGLASVPVVAAAVLLGPRLVLIVFGTKYPEAAQPIAILALGMGIYGFYTVLGSIWVGLGRPIIDSVATGAAMVCTVATGILLIPHLGLIGAASAFSLGAAVRLFVISIYTVWVVAGWRVDHRRVMAADASALQTQPTVIG